MEAWDAESLGLGSLDPLSIQHIIRVARCLVKSTPEEAALDMPAHRLLASMQVRGQTAYISRCCSLQHEMLQCVILEHLTRHTTLGQAFGIQLVKALAWLHGLHHHLGDLGDHGD